MGETREAQRALVEFHPVPFFPLDEGADAMSRLMERLPFGQPNGFDLYPVKSNMLQDSVVKVRVYETQSHFTRQLVIPRIRLRDLVAE